MSRISATASIVAIAILAGSASSFAQGTDGSTGAAAGGQSAGAGTANSSGSPAAAGSSMTTGSAGNRAGVGGTAATGPQTGGDAAIDAENKAIDRRLKSICRGC
jgi:hypothetical protein